MKTIKIYTISDSKPSQELKKYLQEKNVDFEEFEINTGQAAAALMKRTGFSVAPQLEIDNQFIIGFDKKKINKLLNIN